MQTLPLGLARFLSYQEDTTGALYAFCIMVLAPGILLFLLAQNEFIRGLASGANKEGARRRASFRFGGASSSTGSCWCPRLSPWRLRFGMGMLRPPTTESSSA